VLEGIADEPREQIQADRVRDVRRKYRVPRTVGLHGNIDEPGDIQERAQRRVARRDGLDHREIEQPLRQLAGKLRDPQLLRGVERGIGLDRRVQRVPQTGELADGAGQPGERRRAVQRNAGGIVDVHRHVQRVDRGAQVGHRRRDGVEGGLHAAGGHHARAQRDSQLRDQRARILRERLGERLERFAQREGEPFKRALLAAHGFGTAATAALASSLP
jgi:hypothetical protein